MRGIIWCDTMRVNAEVCSRPRPRDPHPSASRSGTVESGPERRLSTATSVGAVSVRFDCQVTAERYRGRPQRPCRDRRSAAESYSLGRQTEIDDTSPGLCGGSRARWGSAQGLGIRARSQGVSDLWGRGPSAPRPRDGNARAAEISTNSGHTRRCRLQATAVHGRPL